MAKTPSNPNPMPPLSVMEREALKASIVADGIRTPILKSAGPWGKGLLIDGFHRAEIGKELGIQVPETVTSIKSEAEFRIAQLDANIARRQLTQVQRIHLARARLPWEQKLAAERIAAGPRGKFDGVETGRSIDLAAKAVGIKADALRKGSFVIENAPKDVRELFERGEISVDRAFRQAKQARGMDARTILEKRVDARISDDLPSGKFGAIIVAPAWRTQAMKFEKGRFLPNELAAIKVRSIATRDGIVCLWSPTNWLREAYDTITAWDARPFGLLVWVTDDAVQGDVVRDRTRFGILASFGKAPVASRKTNTILGGSGMGVPADAYALLDELVPEQRGVVLFGETKRDGWESWAPEID